MLKISSNNNSEAMPNASRFVIYCLGYVPTEFRRFAAELLVSAFRSIIKDAHLVIMNECKSNEDHKMIHELGLSLGVVEWFDDYCSCLSEFEDVLEDFSSEDEVIQSLEVTQSCDSSKRASVMTFRVHSVDDFFIQPTLDSERKETAASTIESIRIEEFGLDPNISITESSLLKKQHARLGRAVHCLSQELYSQDSHILLELVSFSLILSYAPFKDITDNSDMLMLFFL